MGRTTRVMVFFFLKQNVEMYNLHKKQSCKKERKDVQGSDATVVAYADPSDGARPLELVRQSPLRTSRAVVRWPLSCECDGCTSVHMMCLACM